MAILQLYLIKYIHSNISSVFNKHKLSMRATDLFHLCTFFDKLRVLSEEICRNATVNMMTSTLDLRKDLYAQSCKAIAVDLSTEMATILNNADDHQPVTIIDEVRER